jgi:hypothetical protein
LDLIDFAVSSANQSINNLSKLQPTTLADNEIVESLIESNNQLINEISANVQPLIQAIESNDPNLPVILHEVAENLNQSINISNENDQIAVDNAELSRVALEAAKIQDARNENLEEVAKEAEEIAIKVEQTARDFENVYVPKDPRVRQHMGFDDEADIIDLDSIDVEFEGLLDEQEFLEKSKATRKAQTDSHQQRMSSLFDQVEAEDSENIADIDGDFDLLLNESIEALEDVVADLEEAQNKSDSKEEQEKIQELKEKTLDQIEAFEEIQGSRVENLRAKFEQKKSGTMFP